MIFQFGEDMAPGRPRSSFPVLHVASERDGEGLLRRLCSDRTQGNGIKL